MKFQMLKKYGCSAVIAMASAGVPILVGTDARAGNYVNQSILPICVEKPRPEMFSHPVTIKETTSTDSMVSFVDRTVVHFKNWRNVEEMEGIRTGRIPSWIDFGDAGKVFYVGGFGILDCMKAANPLAAGGFRSSVNFDLSGAPVGSAWVLMRMETVVRDFDSVLNAEVSVENKSIFYDSKGKVHRPQDFGPGVVRLVLSGSEDGVTFTPLKESTIFLPGLQPGRGLQEMKIQVSERIPFPGRVRLELVYRQPRRPRPQGNHGLALYDARIEHSVCVPDQSNPGACL